MSLTPGVPSAVAARQRTYTLDRLSAALERDAARVATSELHRRCPRLGSLGSAEEEAIARIVQRVSEGIAACLLAGAKSDHRVFDALHAIYLPDVAQGR